MDSITSSENIVALATPIGESAIAVIRLSGKTCIDLVDKMFSKDLAKKNSHTAVYGNILSGEKILDECIVTIYRSPRSYTKQNSVEIACHGSAFIVDSIIKECLQLGARMANNGEFTLRAFLSGQLDLSQAEAVADLIASDSPLSHEIALKQLRGGVSNELKKMRTKLIDLASLLELELDFGEEDVEFASRSDLNNTIKKNLKSLSDLSQTFHQGNALKHGVKIAIVGKPNAGKSTLLNALLNEERAIVSPVAGTTRDTVEDSLIIKGIKFLISDTAGLRETTDAIEEAGVKRSIQQIDKSQIVIYVVDITLTTADQANQELKELRNNEASTIMVLNKMDLYPTAKPDLYASACNIPASSIIPMSAKNKMNISVLKDRMVDTVKSGTNDTTVISNVRHYDGLKKTESALQKVLESMNMNLSNDLIAMDLRHALHYLGEITGEIHTDDLLDNIFSNFCIGK